MVAVEVMVGVVVVLMVVEEEVKWMLMEVGVGVGGIGDGGIAGDRGGTNMNFFPLPFPSIPSNTSGQMET